VFDFVKTAVRSEVEGGGPQARMGVRGKGRQSLAPLDTGEVLGRYNEGDD